jgi:hypothetical protein
VITWPIQVITSPIWVITFRPIRAITLAGART